MARVSDTKHYVEVAENLYRFIFTKVDLTENVVHGMNERVEVESYLNTIQSGVQLRTIVNITYGLVLWAGSDSQIHSIIVGYEGILLSDQD
ncbi:MAG: hypothetical protein CMQ15_00670 [Gammaproteobacteria bacterium]|nr:hypothetical protein [Gammaproteobacteria bacterium]